jgi:hypothetical protein
MNTHLGLALQPDGNIVVSGITPLWEAFVLLYNDDGTFFSDFGSGGVVKFSLGSFASARAVAYQTDGKIVATGVGKDTGEIYGDVLTFRLLSNPPNQAPVCDANGPYSAECGDSIPLDGSGSYDPDGHPLTFSWSTDCTGGSFDDPSSMTPILTLIPSACFELCNVYLDVTDPGSLTDACDSSVNVEDTTPPVITDITASPNNLWPPNHKMVSINVDVTASDNCGVPVCSITLVESNEPENGLGDGDTAPDWEITGDLTLKLRAERSGKGSGRTYTITATCNDGCDNNSYPTVNVTVSHDKGK